MKIVHKHQLAVGDVLAKDIFTDAGLLYLPEGTVLTESILEKLYEIPTGDIFIDAPDGNDTEKSEDLPAQQKRVFKARYTKTLTHVKGFMDNIRNNDEIDISEVSEITNGLYENVLTQPNLISSLLDLKSQDEYTYRHSMNVAILSVLIGRWLKLDSAKQKELAYAGILHDIGKCKVPLSILNKPGKLTNDEFTEMKRHTLYGFNLIKTMPDLTPSINQAVLFHHERENGKGYPMGLKGEKIPQLAKIISVADTFDAMTSDRVYRKKMNPYFVTQFLMEQGFQDLNPQIVLTFASNIAGLLIGNEVLLSNGAHGKVVYIHAHSPARPVIQVGDTYVDLNQDFSLEIKEVLE